MPVTKVKRKGRSEKLVEMIDLCGSDDDFIESSSNNAPSKKNRACNEDKSSNPNIAKPTLVQNLKRPEVVIPAECIYFSS